MDSSVNKRPLNRISFVKEVVEEERNLSSFVILNSISKLTSGSGNSRSKKGPSSSSLLPPPSTFGSEEGKTVDRAKEVKAMVSPVPFLLLPKEKASMTKKELVRQARCGCRRARKLNWSGGGACDM
ncbi:hypothetical protein HPP92_009646 [Vanilla planifolia]|uniref:Uncharacterized protein n=1 Tax=Vanilla planifolia TaxID=51239 RepID=A0A835R869_VANPL|nr:hypothetical protein HPP92_009646 [Vanilla planifolia]